MMRTSFTNRLGRSLPNDVDAEEIEAIYSRIVGGLRMPEASLKLVQKANQVKKQRSSFSATVQREAEVSPFLRAVESVEADIKKLYSSSYPKPEIEFVAARYESAATAAVVAFAGRCLESGLRLAATRAVAVSQLHKAWTHATVFTAALDDGTISSLDEARRAMEAAAEACDIGYDKAVDDFSRILYRATTTGSDVVLDAFFMLTHKNEKKDEPKSDPNESTEDEIHKNLMNENDADVYADNFNDAARRCLEQLVSSAQTGGEQCRRDVESIRNALSTYETNRKRDDQHNCTEAATRFLDAREAALAAEDTLSRMEQNHYRRNRELFEMTLNETKEAKSQQQAPNGHILLDTIEALCGVERALAKADTDQAERTSRRTREAIERVARIRRDLRSRDLRSQAAVKALRTRLDDRLNALTHAAKALDADANAISTKVKSWLCDHITKMLLAPTLRFAYRDASRVRALAFYLQRYVANTWLRSDANKNIHNALKANLQRAEQDLLRMAEVSRSSTNADTVRAANFALEDARTRLRNFDQDNAYLRQKIASAAPLDAPFHKDTSSSVDDISLSTDYSITFAGLSSNILDFFEQTGASSPFAASILTPAPM